MPCTGSGTLVVFEGIDGSGKTTLSNRVATALRLEGLRVEHVRQDGQFRSNAVQALRELGRDHRNLALGPRAELLLLAARDAQLLEEVTEPALARADVVLADRYFYTAEALAQNGRGLSPGTVKPVLEAASGGRRPDLVILLDVDPGVARARRRIAKIIAPDPRPPSRKGLSGAGLAPRLREGYREIAAREPERWITIDVTEATIDQLAPLLTRLIATALRQGVPRAQELARAAAPTAAGPAARTPADPREALVAFFGWVDRHLEREPDLAAYLLAGLAGPAVDERRWALATSAPEVVAAGLLGLDDRVSWALRRRLTPSVPSQVARSLGGPLLCTAEAGTLRRTLAGLVPADVAHSMHGRDDDESWRLREQLAEDAPDAVLGSLRGLGSARAWAWREQWLARRGGLDRALTPYSAARVAAETVTGLDEPCAWEWRKAAFAAAPVAALGSLAGTTSALAWSWRQRYAARAPKVVLRTIDGMTEGRAWALRAALAPTCREAIDSIRALDHPAAWALRAAALDLWPAAVVETLGPLALTSQGRALIEHALRHHPGNPFLLKQVSAISLGAFPADQTEG